MKKDQLIDLLRRLTRDIREDRVKCANLTITFAEGEKYSVQFGINYKVFLSISSGDQEVLPLE